MADLGALVRDPDFIKLPLSDQRQALTVASGDKDFASLSDMDTQKFLSVARNSSPTQFENERNPANQPGILRSASNAVLNFLKPAAQNPYPGMGQEDKAAAATQAKTEDQARKDAGRSLAYRAVAVPASVVTDVPNMEHNADIGNSRGIVGQAVGSAAPVVAGAALGELAPKLGPKIESSLAEKSKAMYQSALKPSTRLSQTKVASAIDTGLSNNIPVSEAGIEKLSQLIDATNDKIKATIAADPMRPINKFAVANRLYDTADTFKNQVNPTADLQAITDAGKDFIKTQPTNIPAEDAQALKQGTYRQLSDKAYGEMKSASIEAQKSLARGLKEELATAFPELQDLNAKDSQFYGLEPLLEKAVQRISNHQLIGIGTPAVGIAAKAVTGSSKAAGVAGMLKMVIDNPSVKSRLAIMLNKASKGAVTPGMAGGRIAAYSAALGQAAAPSPDATSGASEVVADRAN